LDLEAGSRKACSRANKLTIPASARLGMYFVPDTQRMQQEEKKAALNLDAPS
jgi:hypothetical protein